MLMKDPKKVAQLIISGKTKVENSDDSSSEQDNSVAEETAAQEFIDAVHSNDAKGLVEAFKSLMSICDVPEESGDME